MNIVDHRGSLLPLVPFPGGDLLLVAGAGDSLYLQNFEDTPYRHADGNVFLNPHFMLTPSAVVEVRSHADGRPSGMCFHGGVSGADLPVKDTEALFGDLAGHLTNAFATDPDLLAHVRREAAEADLRRAEEEVERAAMALSEAGRAAIEARIRLGATTFGQSDPDGERPAFFIVAAIPEACDGLQVSRIGLEVRTLAQEACIPAGRLPGPVMAILHRC